MKYDQEYIYTLLLRKQLGDLSEVEDKLLQKVIQTDEQVRKCWLEQEEAILYTNSEFLNDLRVENDWYQVAAILAPRPFHVRAFRLVKRYSAAAAILVAICVIGGGLLFFRKQVQPAFLPSKPAVLAKHITTPRSNRMRAPLQVAVLPETVTSDASLTVAEPEHDSMMVQAPPPPGRITHDSIYQSSAVEWNTLTVPPQTDYRIELSDGTEVHLNASSTLRFPFIFPGKTREVYLEGEAYFTVAHNPSQPFIVHTGTTSVIALGTAFNVNSYDANVITTSLVTGSVITDVGDSLDVTLKPGYEAIYRPGERFKVKRFDEDVTLGWRDGIYRFRKKPLAELGPVMMRWFGLKLEFASPSIARQTFSGELDKDQSVKVFLEEICLETGLDYQIYDGTVHFAIKKP